MGVPELRKIAALDERPLESFSGKTVCLDAHHFLYVQTNVIIRYRDESDYTRSDGVELPHILALLQGIPSIRRAGIEPIFVFDGQADPMKAEEVERREEKKEEAKERMEAALESGDMETARKFKAQAQSITERVIETTQQLLDHLGIAYVTAPKSGESFAADLVKSGRADAVMTDDYDALLFQSPVTIRQYTGKGPAEEMVLEETLSENNISYEQLVGVALLCGTDYNDGVNGIGPKRGLKKIKTHGDIHTALNHIDGDIPHAEDVRSIFLQSNGTSDLTEINKPDSDYERAVAYATSCGVPAGEAIDKMKRFPEY